MRDVLPVLDPDLAEYSTRDIADALGVTDSRVRYHARKLFPNAGGWYRLSLSEATRLLKYIWRVRYQERQDATRKALTQHLKLRATK